MEITGVLIDGAVPRTDFERCEVLLDYAITLYKHLDPLDLNVQAQWKAKQDELAYNVKTPRIIYDGHFPEIEDELISHINDLLGNQYVCTLGEPDPGDVIVRTTELDIETGERY